MNEQRSTGEGSQPAWGPDGTELFYVATNGGLVRVPVETRLTGPYL